MKVRTLPREKWAALNDADLDLILNRLFPKDSRVVVVENGSGEIVARMAVLSIPHFESFWISKEAFGNPGITRALLRECMRQATATGQSCVFVNSDNEATSAVLERLGGVRLPVETYLLPLRAIREV